MEIVGVIPAAGYGTRLQPLEVSKEVMVVGGKPVMDFLVARMRAGGCSSLRVVTRPAKEDVIVHAEELGAEVVLGDPATVSESFVRGIDGLSPGDIVLMGFPDTIWEPGDGYRNLVHAVQNGADVALGLFRIREADLGRSDVVSLDGSGAVTGIAVKPRVPPSEWIWGCAAARVMALSTLDETSWPGEYFDHLCREQRRVEGIRLSDVWVDLGTKDALALAETLDPSLRTAGPRRGRSP